MAEDITFALDWANDDENLALHSPDETISGRAVKNRISSEQIKAWVDQGSVVTILTENIPPKYAKPMIDAGAQILRCSGNATAAYRTELKLDKDHRTDARMIWELAIKNPAAFRRYQFDPPLNALYAAYREFKDMRIRAHNRCYASEHEQTLKLLGTIDTFETTLADIIEAELKKHAIYNVFLAPLGLKTNCAAGLLFFAQPRKFDNVSKLWKYLGLDTRPNEDGTRSAPKRERGKELGYSNKGRAFMIGVIGSQLLRTNAPTYREAYDRARDSFLARGKTKGHANRHGVRVMVKLFLQHYWQKSREIEGLPVTLPYALTLPNHSHYIPAPTQDEIDVRRALINAKKQDTRRRNLAEKSKHTVGDDAA